VITLATEITNPVTLNRKTMKTKQLHNEISVGNTVMKLALVSGVLLCCMYGILMAFASAFKVLG